MPSIKLYERITPNISKFFYVSKSDFDEMLESSKILDLSLDNARLINGLLSVKSGNPLDTVTYVREDRGNGFLRYYHVQSVNYRGDGLYVFNVSLDIFATYAYDASYENFFVQRSNRFCGFQTVKFDNIEIASRYAINDQSVNPKAYINYTPLREVTLDDVYIVFAVDIETYKDHSLFHGTITASDRMIFAVRPIDCIETEIPSYFSLAYIERAIKAISSIYGVQIGNTQNDANVCGIWIVPREFLGFLDSDPVLLPNFLTVFPIQTETWVDPLNPSTFYTYIKGLKSLHYSFVSIPFKIDNYPEKAAFFGTKSSFLEIPRVVDFNGKIGANIEVLVKKDEIQIIARCGENQIDITDSFSVGIPNSKGSLKPEERIARGVQTVGALAGAATQMAAGNYVSGALNAVTAVLPKDKPQNAMYKSNGDGLTTWTKTSLPDDTASIEYPISVTYYESAKGSSENKRLRTYGAIIDQYISDLITDPLSFCMLSNPIDDLINEKETFLQASCDVSGIPIEAASFIKSTLANGVHLCRA